MIRIFKTFILLSAIFMTVWFIIQNDGQVSIAWFDYKLETSFIFAIIVLLFLLLLFSMIINIFSFIRKLPNRVTGKYYQIKSRKKHSILLDGISAILFGDINKAEAISAKIITQDNPEENESDLLYILMTAFIYSKTKKNQLAINLYKKLYRNNKEFLFCIRGIIENSIELGNFAEAQEYAEEFYKNHHNNDWIKIKLLQIYKHQHLWKKAEKILNKIDQNAASNMNIDIKSEYQTIYLSHAKTLNATGDFDEAVDELEKLMKIVLNKDAILFLASLYAKINKPKLAIQVIEKGWKESPQREYLEFIIKALSEEKFEKIHLKLKELIDIHPGHYIGFVLTAKFLISNNKFEEANQLMSKLLEFHQPNSEIAKIMIMIELHYNAKSQIINQWIEKL